MRMSHASAKLAPMPTAGPFIAAITGFGIVRRRIRIGMYSVRSTLPTSSGERMPAPAAISVTSAPDENARPEPVSTTTRTASSRSACLTASPSWRRVKAPIAFIFSGRLNWIQPIPPSTSRLTCCSTSVVISSSSEYALSFLEEGAHALLLVFGREQEVEALALRREAVRKRPLESLQHGFLRHPDRERRFLGDLAGHALRDLDRHLRGYDLVHDPELVRAQRGHRRSGQRYLHRGVLAGGTRPPLRSAGARDDAEVDLRLAETGVVPRDDQVAHQRHLAPAAQRVAVDRGDQRLAEPGERRPTSGLLANKLIDGRLLRPVADVGPRRAPLRPARQDHRPHAVVGIELGQRPSQLADQGGAQGVQDLGPVERHGRDRRLDLDEDVLVPHRGYHRLNGQSQIG